MGQTIAAAEIRQRSGAQKPKRFAIGLGIAAASLVVLAIVTVAAFALSSVSSQIPLVRDIVE